MTDIGELVSMANLSDKPDKCPFCKKKPAGHTSKSRHGETNSDVKSIPSQLNCGRISGEGEGKWTTAAHHLICAKQCYAKLKPLVRMGNMVGYDINSKPNGLALPTFKNKYDGKIWSNDPKNKGKKKNYGELDINGKRRIAKWAMKKTKAQWHVGHHKFEQQIDWDIEEFGENNEMPHESSYDNAVLRRLYEIWETFGTDNPLCEDPEDRSDDFKQDLNDLSTEIRNKLQEFSGTSPWKSKPYFVSQRAVEFASDAKKASTNR